MTLTDVFNQLRDTLHKKAEINMNFPDQAWLENYPPTMLINLPYGACNHNCFLLAYILCSAGIPATVEFAPQGGAYIQGHTWNVVPDESGKMIPCSINTEMGKWKMDERIDVPKVYRYVYSED
ncbi:MAG: hypothetical protein LBG15_13210, partial [Dysgonamonadaceae bacterium]|nr:hypothetical protein [Dysgonamonadaceae bacterium]